jgi:hypothetical protein
MQHIFIRSLLFVGGLFLLLPFAFHSLPVTGSESNMLSPLRAAVHITIIGAAKLANPTSH